MNRRRIFVALAIVLPVAVFIPAKIAASWRPVAVGRVRQQAAQPAHLMGASQRYVWTENYYLVGDMAESKRTLYDLETGKTRLLTPHEGIASEGAWRFLLQTDTKQPRLLVREGDAPPVSYALRSDAIHASARAVRAFRVDAALHRVELLLGNRFYRWNQKSGQLEQTVKLAREFGEDTVLSRDGEKVIVAHIYSRDSGIASGVDVGTTRTGRPIKSLPIVGFVEANSALATPFGRFVFYDADSQWPDKHWHIMDVSNGRVLWNYRRNSYKSPIVSPDETMLALNWPDRQLWELRDLRTGALARTLPLVPGANAAAFSPDGATLYSVANGVLYRQRAR